MFIHFQCVSTPATPPKMTRSPTTFFSPSVCVAHCQLTEFMRLHANSNPGSCMVSWIGKNNGQRISRIRLCLSATLNRCESYFLVFKLNQTPQSLMFINQKSHALRSFFHTNRACQLKRTRGATSTPQTRPRLAKNPDIEIQPSRFFDSM